MSLPSVFFALGKTASLPSVFLPSGKELLCRVPEKKHSANHMTLGKEPDSGSVLLCVYTYRISRAVHLETTTYNL
jgi:hypothetical protein